MVLQPSIESLSHASNNSRICLSTSTSFVGKTFIPLEYKKHGLFPEVVSIVRMNNDSRQCTMLQDGARDKTYQPSTMLDLILFHIYPRKQGFGKSEEMGFAQNLDSIQKTVNSRTVEVSKSISKCISIEQKQ